MLGGEGALSAELLDHGGGGHLGHALGNIHPVLLGVVEGIVGEGLHLGIKVGAVHAVDEVHGLREVIHKLAVGVGGEVRPVNGLGHDAQSHVAQLLLHRSHTGVLPQLGVDLIQHAPLVQGGHEAVAVGVSGQSAIHDDEVDPQKGGDVPPRALGGGLTADSQGGVQQGIQELTEGGALDADKAPPLQPRGGGAVEEVGGQHAGEGRVPQAVAQVVEDLLLLVGGLIGLGDHLDDTGEVLADRHAGHHLAAQGQGNALQLGDGGGIENEIAAQGAEDGRPAVVDHGLHRFHNVGGDHLVQGNVHALKAAKEGAGGGEHTQKGGHHAEGGQKTAESSRKAPHKAIVTAMPRGVGRLIGGGVEGGGTAGGTHVAGIVGVIASPAQDGGGDDPQDQPQDDKEGNEEEGGHQGVGHGDEDGFRMGEGLPQGLQRGDVQGDDLGGHMGGLIRKPQGEGDGPQRADQYGGQPHGGVDKAPSQAPPYLDEDSQQGDPQENEGKEGK